MAPCAGIQMKGFIISFLLALAMGALVFTAGGYDHISQVVGSATFLLVLMISIEGAIIRDMTRMVAMSIHEKLLNEEVEKEKP